MPRKRRPRRAGSGLGEKHGKLYLDFRHRGIRCKEYVNDAATSESRAKWEAKLAIIKAEIKAGAFEYRRWFPNGTRLRVFHPEIAPALDLTVGWWLRHWLTLRSPFRPDGSLIADAEIHPSTWLHDGSIIEKRCVPALGHLKLPELTHAECEEWERSLKDDNLSGKSVLNYMGLLHKAMADAVDRKLIVENPVPRLRSGRRRSSSRTMRKDSKPLMADEVRTFIDALPPRVDRLDGTFVGGAVLRDLYGFWFRTGWRPNEIMALRFDWLSSERQTIEVRRGRMPRCGGLEASPKEGEREVVCDYDPVLWEILERRQRESLQTGQRDYVFTDSHGRPLSQEWLGKRVWNPTIKTIGLSSRGQYNVRDTFITIALSAGEDPGWVAHVCGNSEQMIFEHYRTWMPKLRRGHGRQLIGMLGLGPRLGPKMGPKHREKKAVRVGNQVVGKWRRGESNPRPEVLH